MVARDIRIATGFFTVQGYNMIRSALVGKYVMILVGFDETSAERLKAKMVEDIMAHLARWDEHNRRESVLDLVRKIQAGDFRIVERAGNDILDARIRRGDHAKLYILDTTRVLVGSSNLTVSGLRYNVEAIAAHDDSARVMQWLQWFDNYWNAHDTYDLTQALLDALLRWLDFASPYDMYLKTILALMPNDELLAPRESYKKPVAYQQVVIERMLRQLEDWRGTFLVASTGLGKTVMATHTAYRLRSTNTIYNVLVFAPKPVFPDWKIALSSAGLSHQLFTRDLLDRRKLQGEKGEELQRALDLVDEKHIILIDESHQFRNRLNATGEQERSSFKRLGDIIKNKKPRVILLTATPLAKGVDDLNNQLYLLPHTAPPTNVCPSGQMVLEPFIHNVLDPNAWQLPDTEDFIEDFMQLPVCTVISTSQVAKNFATRTDEGEYIDFGSERLWLPQIEVHKIRVPVLLETAMSQAIDQGYFKHQLKQFKTRQGFYCSDSNIEQQALIAWMSSPLALSEVVTRTITGDYDVTFIRSQKERQDVLQPLADQLKSLDCTDDQKLQALIMLIRYYHEKQQKVLIFTERRATAVYIERGIAQLLPEARAACVAYETDHGTYELKDFDQEVYHLILAFAPIANKDKQTSHSKKHSYDIFITTDAYAAGVNLQDASVVVHYDLAWIPEVIIQRAGRILRFWKEPRQISLHIFVGDFVADTSFQNSAHRVEERLQRLVQRTRHAEKFSELPIIPDGDSATYETLGDLSSVTMEYLGRADATQIEEFSGESPFLRHITELKQHMGYAKQIPDDSTSARYYSGKQHLIYLLLRYQDEYDWTLYDVYHHHLIEKKEDALLNLLQCPKEMAPAPIDPALVEKYAQTAKKKWIETRAIGTSDVVERICALYLIPETEERIAWL